MEESELAKIESKIYIFSVDVYSFVKTLHKQNITNSSINSLLKDSGQLYTNFLDLFENHIKKDKQVAINTCIDLSKLCAEKLSNIELSGSNLNERVDLLIEAKEIIRILEKLHPD